MPDHLSRKPVGLAAAALALIMAVAAIAGELAGSIAYDMSWNTVDFGGGVSSGSSGAGSLEFTSTIGQPDASAVSMAGGGFEFTPGFWKGVQPACPADIFPTSGGDNMVNVDDLLFVINSWGACPNPNDCPADIVPPGGNDIVNIEDLVKVINDWGLCP